MDTIPTPFRVDSRPQPRIRSAEKRDAAEIAQIYHQATQDGLATFESFLASPDERERWVEEHRGRFPLLVAEWSGRLLGWASLSPYPIRPHIDGVVEMLIYIDRDFRRHGVGRELMRALQVAARETGHRKIIGRFVVHNDAGRTLCRQTGWREVGMHLEHMYLDGRWQDMVIVEYLIPENLK